MKKIFAIALALVMVLSMASAFASQCNVGPYTWTCSSDSAECAKASVEVIPYVKVNNSCGGYSWEKSTCAGAVNSENVYYAIKLNVPEDMNLDWWATAKIALEAEGVKLPKALTTPTDWTVAGAYFAGVDTTEDEDVSYYLLNDVSAWKDVEDVDDLNDVIFTSKVTDAKDAEVCAVLTAEWGALGDWIEVGDYMIAVTSSVDEIYIADACGWVDYATSWATNGIARLVIVDGVVKAEADFTTKCSAAEYKAALNYFGLAIGTCVEKDAIQANFGWDDEFKACATWSDKAASIVDADCVVAIPKTGDASVLAWLF